MNKVKRRQFDFNARWLAEEVGMELERVIKAKKITRRELGQICNCTRDRINGIILGDLDITIREAMELFKACGADLTFTMVKR